MLAAAAERLGPGYKPSGNLQAIIANALGGVQKGIANAVKAQTMITTGVALSAQAMPVWGQIAAGLTTLATNLLGGACASKIQGIVQERLKELNAYGETRQAALMSALTDAYNYSQATGRLLAGSNQPLNLETRDFADVFQLRSRIISPKISFNGLGSLPFECNTGPVRKKMADAVEAAKRAIDDTIDPVLGKTKEDGFRAFMAKLTAIQLRWNTPEFYPMARKYDGAPEKDFSTAADQAAKTKKTALIVGGGAAAALLALVAAR
jgi:hypothetical protein